MRIIVIEDEERLLHGLIHLIERIGEQFKVVGSAMDGVSGMALIEQLRPDVTFTDIRMPGMSGLDLIGRLSTRQPPACHFVIISAYSDFEYARQALRYGVSDYILKPVTYEEIERLLYRLADVPSRSPFEQGMVEEVFPMPDPCSPLVRQAIEIIRTEYAGRLSLDDVATRLNVSNEYFSQLFSKTMSVTFTAYLKRYRVDAAKRLLLERRWKIQDVTEMVGYADAKYFCRVFREIAGQSPTEYVAANPPCPPMTQQ